MNIERHTQLHSPGTPSFNLTIDQSTITFITYLHIMKIIVALDANDSELKLQENVKEEEDFKEEEDLETAGRYSEDDADITIISSDRIAFKVQSFLLLRASYVLLYS